MNYGGAEWAKMDGEDEWRAWHLWLQATTTADEMARQLSVPTVDMDYVLEKVARLRAKAEWQGRLLLKALCTSDEVPEISPADLGEYMLAVAGDAQAAPQDVPAIPQTPEEEARILMEGKS